MLKTRALVTAALVACTAGAATAQSTNLFLFKSEDLSTISAIPTLPPTADNFGIGNNPSAVLLDGNSLYVAGFVNSANVGAGIVRINNVFGSRSFTRVGLFENVPNGQGIWTLDLVKPTSTDAWLLGSARGNANQQVQVFQVAGTTPTRLARMAAGLPTIQSGSAWDMGRLGTGVLVSTAPDVREPLVSQLAFGFQGPWGARLKTAADPAAVPAAPFWLEFRRDNADPVLDVGYTQVTTTNNPAPVGSVLLNAGGASTEWRGIDIDKRNGTIAAFSDNGITVVDRPVSDLATVPRYGIDTVTNRYLRITNGQSLPAFVNGRNLRILTDYTDAGTGDLIIWNARSSAGTGQAFNAVVQATQYAAPASPNTLPNAVTINWRTAANQPITFGPPSVSTTNLDNIDNGNAYYSFSWDTNLKVLVVADFINRRAYFFSNTQPGACTRTDGSCVQLPSSVCTLVGGTFSAAGQACPTGACCNSVTAVCSVTVQQVCGNTGAGGWTINGTCSPNVCASGACCDSVGACTITGPNGCTAVGSVYAAGAVCSPNACIAGSCCVGTTCSTGNGAQCAGTFTAAGTCTPDPCVVVSNIVCCRGATCSIVTDYTNCTASGGAGVPVTPPAGTVCNASGNNVTPCCHGDYNKNGLVQVPDIFAFLGDWFANSPYAFVGGDGTGVGSPGVPAIFAFLGAWFAGCP